MDVQAKDSVEVTGIYMRGSEGGDIELLAEVDGEWRLLFSTQMSGEIGVIVEPRGIRLAPPDPVGE